MVGLTPEVAATSAALAAELARPVRPAPGVYSRIAWEVYSSWDCVRSSYLAKFKRSPLHAKVGWMEEPTRAMDLGTAVHCAALEPDRFESAYTRMPEFGDQRTPANKAKAKAWEAENAGKGILKDKDFEAVLRIRESIWSHAWAQELLCGLGQNELSGVWTDAEFDVACKLRIDRLQGNFDGYPTIVDLKTTRDASPEAFRRSITNYDYDLQCAFYLDGLEALSPRARHWIWIAVETAPPYAAALYTPDEDIFENGRRRYKAALAAHVECVRNDVWPGYPSQPVLISLPPWAKAKRHEDPEEEVF